MSSNIPVPIPLKETFLFNTSSFSSQTTFINMDPSECNQSLSPKVSKTIATTETVGNNDNEKNLQNIKISNNEQTINHCHDSFISPTESVTSTPDTSKGLLSADPVTSLSTKQNANIFKYSKQELLKLSKKHVRATSFNISLPTLIHHPNATNIHPHFLNNTTEKPIQELEEGEIVSKIQTQDVETSSITTTIKDPPIHPNSPLLINTTSTINSPLNESLSSSSSTQYSLNNNSFDKHKRGFSYPVVPKQKNSSNDPLSSNSSNLTSWSLHDAFSGLQLCDILKANSNTSSKPTSLTCSDSKSARVESFSCTNSTYSHSENEFNRSSALSQSSFPYHHHHDRLNQWMDHSLTTDSSKNENLTAIPSTLASTCSMPHSSTDLDLSTSSTYSFSTQEKEFGSNFNSPHFHTPSSSTPYSTSSSAGGFVSMSSPLSHFPSSSSSSSSSPSSSRVPSIVNTGPAPSLFSFPVPSTSSTTTSTSSSSSSSDMYDSALNMANASSPVYLPNSLTSSILLTSKSPWSRVPGDPEFSSQPAPQSSHPLPMTHSSSSASLISSPTHKCPSKPRLRTSLNPTLNFNSSTMYPFSSSKNDSFFLPSEELVKEGDRNFYHRPLSPPKYTFTSSDVYRPLGSSSSSSSSNVSTKSTSSSSSSPSVSKDLFYSPSHSRVHSSSSTPMMDASLMKLGKDYQNPYAEASPTFFSNPYFTNVQGASLPASRFSPSAMNIASYSCNMDSQKESPVFSSTLSIPTMVTLPTKTSPSKFNLVPTPAASPPSASNTSFNASMVYPTLQAHPIHSMSMPLEDFHSLSTSTLNPSTTTPSTKTSTSTSTSSSSSSNKLSGYMTSTPPSIRSVRPIPLPTPPIASPRPTIPIFSPSHSTHSSKHSYFGLKTSSSCLPTSSTISTISSLPSLPIPHSAYGFSRCDYNLSPIPPTSSKAKYPPFPVTQKGSPTSPTNLSSQNRLSEPPDLKKVVEKYLRDGDQVTLERYLSWISSLHPSAMQAFLKGLLSLGIKLKAREMLAYAIYHGLNGHYYSIQDVFESLAQIDLGIMDMINGTTVEAISFLLAYFLKDGVIAPNQLEWLIYQYRANDPDATSRLVGSIVAKLWSVVSPPEFFAVMHGINLHTLFDVNSKEDLAFELAKFVDSLLIEKLI